jgi:hypothetical protein
MTRRRLALLGLAVVLVVVAGGAVVASGALRGGCSADHLPDTIGIYHRTSTELPTLDPMPVASGVRMGPPQLVLELPADGTCAAMDSGPMGIWLKVSPTRYVLFARPGGP